MPSAANMERARVMMRSMVRADMIAEELDAAEARGRNGDHPDELPGDGTARGYVAVDLAATQEHDAYTRGYRHGVDDVAKFVENHCCVSSCCDAQPGSSEARALAACIRKNVAPPKNDRLRGELKTAREALRQAILGLRSLDGMTGSAAVRATSIKATGYRIAEALGIKNAGYHPLDEVEEALAKIHKRHA